MVKKRRRFWTRTAFSLLTICTCIFTLFNTQPIKGSTAYITSLSPTCVNVFSAEDGTDTPPDPPVPPTGIGLDVTRLFHTILISLTVIVLTYGAGRKRNDIKTKLQY